MKLQIDQAISIYPALYQKLYAHEVSSYISLSYESKENLQRGKSKKDWKCICILFTVQVQAALGMEQSVTGWHLDRGPFQYAIRRLIVRSRKVPKPWDWLFKLSHRFEILTGVCQISKRSHNSKHKSRGFETSRDLTIRRLIAYWNGPRSPDWYGDGNETQELLQCQLCPYRRL